MSIVVTLSTSTVKHLLTFTGGIKNRYPPCYHVSMFVAPDTEIIVKVIIHSEVGKSTLPSLHFNILNVKMACTALKTRLANNAISYAAYVQHNTLWTFSDTHRINM